MKQYVKLLKGKRSRSDLTIQFKGSSGPGTSVLSGQHQFERSDKGIGNVAPRSVIALCAIRPVRTEACLSVGCWRNGRKRPVLKHGPRSLTCVRVGGFVNLRGVRKLTGENPSPWGALPTDLELVRRVRVRAHLLGPERW